jgi:hypothetical protein
MSGDWQAPLQLPGEQWFGVGSVEQQFDEHSPSVVQPAQTYSPPRVVQVCPEPHDQPHTPQLAVVVVSTGLPPQHRAYGSDLFQLVLSGRTADAPQAPLAHVGVEWQASVAFPHTVPLALATAAEHAPATQVGTSWQASGAVPQGVPSMTGSAAAHTPALHPGAA